VNKEAFSTQKLTEKVLAPKQERSEFVPRSREIRNSEKNSKKIQSNSKKISIKF